MTVEEKLRAVMQAHDAGAPTHVPWPAAEVRTHRRASSRVLVSAALVAVVVAGGAWALVAWPRTSHTPSAAAALACPADRSPYADTSTVPSPATVPGASDHLVPPATPDSVLVCGYVIPGLQGIGDNPTPLSSSVQLSGDLSAVPAQLSSLPAADANSAGTCLPDARDIDDDSFLIGLTYPDGIVWVSVIGDSCVGAGNGVFLTATNIGVLVATWLADGVAGPAPVDANRTDPAPSSPTPTSTTPGATTPSDGTPSSPSNLPPSATTSVPGGFRTVVFGCDNGAAGRPDEGDRMVPGTPTTLSICTATGHDNAPTFAVAPDRLAEVVAALNGVAATPRVIRSDICGPPATADPTVYSLLFGYADGTEVQVIVQGGGCPGSVGNGSLESSDASTVLPLLQSLTR